MKVFVSAGHSNTDSGAAAFGFTESKLVTEFRNLVVFYLSNSDITYEADALGSNNIPLKDAIKKARSFDIAVEFHLNSGPASASGVETLSAPKDFRLGNALCQAVSRTLNIQNRGAKPENSGQHSRLGFVQAGGIILELFFITNKEELDKYLAKKWLVAKAVADVLIREAKNGVH